MTSHPRAPILVKRYAGGRLYDGAAGRYVALGDLEAWRAAGTSFVVIDARTGEDVTHVPMT